MTINYLLDEHIPLSYRTQMLRRYPQLKVWAIGDPNTPPKGTSDPDILRWCEDNGFILVTNNRKTMPVHLKDHLAAGLHVPGIFIINEDMSMGQIMEELIIIAEASIEDEYKDQISFMPLL
ncbi:MULTISPECIES: DUF5615 family PIN-like protein [Moorena]|uniref:DUF5615 domain-containing protein n=1 Tax=Moorena producens PAL-8-15-08-1 TaxID=1458985 RepID=A0A1D8TMC0_9CYAN|nr:MULTISPECIES: DUF5615 family PIN-like protein [Moorena]AOW98764.1 hypothetical protein BJP34_04240 [Moorena producens PAL-8-15-08-1]NEO15078.1 hypothetical protein [Moorena sp. SIO3E8]NEQ01665.1 hypothetical protein [Moorena sp. SIO3F7]